MCHITYQHLEGCSLRWRCVICSSFIDFIYVVLWQIATNKTLHSGEYKQTEILNSQIPLLFVSTKVFPVFLMASKKITASSTNAKYSRESLHCRRLTAKSCVKSLLFQISFQTNKIDFVLLVIHKRFDTVPSLTPLQFASVCMCVCVFIFIFEVVPL